MSDFCILLGGTRVPEAPPLLLEAGPLSASFDPDTAFLRDIRWHQAPALMGVYGAVRDRFWGTVDPEVTDLVVERPAGGVRVTFEALCRRDAIRFRWRGRIELAAEGRLRFDFDGEAESAFPRNRIGLCVLHGVLECAGEPCGVTQTSGRCIEGVFPQRIAPHQPFRDIRSIAHELRNGASCTLTLTGETFEMEDQRNWSDASFKTYGTPLDLPIPVQLGAGERVRQSVEVVLGPPTAHVLALPRAGSAGLLVCRRGAAQALPTIGHGLGPECLSEGDTALLRRFARPQLLRYGCRPGVGNWEADLCAAAETARGLGADLEVALALPEPGGDALRTLGDCLRREKLRVARWLILSAAEPCTAPGALAEARRTLARLSRGSVFAVGTAGHFAELNRGRPAADRAGFVAYALAAEVHAHDRRTILENAWAAGWTVDAAALLYPGKRIEVGPVSLRPRQESPRPADPGGGPAAAVAPLPDWADPRQVSLFGACFTLAVVVSLAAAEADTVILFDAVGMEGLMESSAAPPRPEGFPSRAGQVYPLFHVLADLREAGEGVFAPCVVQGHPLLPALQCRSAGQRRILLANPGAEAVQVRLPSACHPRRCRCLDAAALAQATAAPEAFRARDALRPLRSQIIELPPWAYLCIIEEDHA